MIKPAGHTEATAKQYVVRNELVDRCLAWMDGIRPLDNSVDRKYLHPIPSQEEINALTIDGRITQHPRFGHLSHFLFELYRNSPDKVIVYDLDAPVEWVAKRRLKKVLINKGLIRSCGSCADVIVNLGSIGVAAGDEALIINFGRIEYVLNAFPPVLMNFGELPPVDKLRYAMRPSQLITTIGAYAREDPQAIAKIGSPQEIRELILELL